ncbi:MAG: hypothetical protein AB4290_30855 [Spirulina sp.]
MKKAQWIEIGEYLAIAMSASGTLVALLTEKVVYAAAPLTLAVGLNLWQRKQTLEKQIEEQIKAEDWASIQYQLTAAIERQNRLENATEQPHPEIVQRLQELADAIASVEQRLAPIRERQAQLEESDRETNAEFQQQLTVLQTAIATVEGLPEQFSQLQVAIATVEELPEQFSQLQAAIASLEEKVAPLGDDRERWETSTREIAQMSATIATLREDLAALDRRLSQLSTLPPPEQIQELQSAIANLQENLPPSKGESASSSESAIAEQVKQQNQPAAEIQGNIAGLSQPPPVDPNTQELQAAIARIQKRLEGLPEIVPNPPVAEPPEPETASEHRPPSVPSEYRREAFTSPEPSPMPEEAPEWEDREEPPPSLPPFTPPRLDEIEGGIREISENLWEFGASIKNIFDRVTTPDATVELKQEWECIWEFANHAEGLAALAIAPNGKLLVSPGGDRCLQLWDLETGEPIRTLTGHTDAIAALAFSPDGTQLASSSTDGTLKLWQVETGTEIANLRGHSAPIAAISFSPHGRTLASGSYDKTIKLWDLGSQRVLRTLDGHWDWVSAIAYDPDGTTLASGSHDGTIKFWNVEDGEKIGNVAPGGKIYAIAYNPDGTMLASGGSDRHIRLWNRDRQELRQIRVLSHVYSLAFSPDGKILASGTSHRTITLWDGETGEKIALLVGHRDRVNVVEFGDRGDLLASGGDDGIVRVWKRIENEE